jgi:predicted dienelactone hydrolase
LKKIFLLMFFMSNCLFVMAQPNRIDTVGPDAPELAQFGSYDIGVRTVQFTNPDSVDLINTIAGGETVLYDRTLAVEIWYPALLADNQSAGGQYFTTTRNPDISAILLGLAVRDAGPVVDESNFPLVVLSHGHPGNRYIMIHLAESLASKGYVVASIDHKDSTYEDPQSFNSTLYNRPLDQRFVLNSIDELSNDSASFLNGVVDTSSTGVVGYSMGGYGLVNNLGGGYSDEIMGNSGVPPNNLLYQHATGNPEYRDNLDSRIKVGVAVAPWGMNMGFWRPSDLLGIEVPTLYIAGDVDTTSGYKEGTRAIFENAVNSDRYLLTFKKAGHNAGAPYPLPNEIVNSDDKTGATHYTDPVWDTLRMNNIMDHFVTAYLDYYLKGKEESISYLDVVPDSADAIYSINLGKPDASHTYWKGFLMMTAEGLKMEHLATGQ